MLKPEIKLLIKSIIKEMKIKVIFTFLEIYVKYYNNFINIFNLKYLPKK